MKKLVYLLLRVEGEALPAGLTDMRVGMLASRTGTRVKVNGRNLIELCLVYNGTTLFVPPRSFRICGESTDANPTLVKFWMKSGAELGKVAEGEDFEPYDA